jgi:hypothetical protein
MGRAQLEALVQEGLTVREIGARLGRSAGSVTYWLRRHGLVTKRSQPRHPSPEGTPKYVTRKCRNHGEGRFVWEGRGAYRCVRCRAERVVARRRQLKEILVAEAGGCCALCGYDRCVRALNFHHLDPSTKRFGLGERGLTRSLEILRIEARKCLLLCANCHMEVEHGVAALPASVPAAHPQMTV